MAFHVEISPRAFNDLDEISGYIKQQGSFAQARFGNFHRIFLRGAARSGCRRESSSDRGAVPPRPRTYPAHPSQLVNAFAGLAKKIRRNSNLQGILQVDGRNEARRMASKGGGGEGAGTVARGLERRASGMCNRLHTVRMRLGTRCSGSSTACTRTICLCNRLHNTQESSAPESACYQPAPEHILSVHRESCFG